MALSTTHRLAIFQALAPIVGEEPTDAMLAQFPSRDRDEPLTRDYLDLRLAELAAELRGEMADLRAELRNEMAELRADVRIEMGEHQVSLLGEIRALETRLTIRFLVFLGLVTAIARFVLPTP